MCTPDFNYDSDISSNHLYKPAWRLFFFNPMEKPKEKKQNKKEKHGNCISWTFKGSRSLLHEKPTIFKGPVACSCSLLSCCWNKEENLFKHGKKIPHFHCNHFFLSFQFHIVISNKGLNLKRLNYLPHFCLKEGSWRRLLTAATHSGNVAVKWDAGRLAVTANTKDSC